MIAPELLCRQHLLGEHNELHKIVGHIAKGNIEVVRGHAKRKQVVTSKIGERHGRLVQEMEARGYNHHSPLDYEDELGVGEVDLEDNIGDLKSRCAHCRERMLGLDKTDS